MEQLTQFQTQQFLCLESYRKNGKAVQTPVGFVLDDGSLWILTDVQSAKVKRIRNNPHVRVVPSTPRGEPRGAWIDATATLMDESVSAHVRQMILAKYGLMWRVFEFVLGLRAILKKRRPMIQIAIRLVPQTHFENTSEISTANVA